MNEITKSELLQQEPEGSLDDIVAGLVGFGVEENEEILTIRTKKRDVRIRISNYTTEEELTALLATEGTKGYEWMRRIKAEILSRAISWVDGVSIRNLTPVQRMVPDPTDPERTKRDIQVVLYNLMMGWGNETLNVLWKVLMVHSQRIEDRLQEAFPDSAILTDVEKRFMEQALREVEDTTRKYIEEQVSDIFGDDEKETTKEK